MATFIHGIGASENIDSSGEIVSIAGLDISSLDKDGVFNFEHKSDTPAQVVGKILKARKIFSDADCEDEHQLKFWEKVKVPYLYVMGELFDDYSDSAREVAGRFRYDADKKGQNERAVMNFSVEGSKISKEGITVSRSIARKITITVLPCNKAAVAEMVAISTKPKNNIDELFKTEGVEIEILSLKKGDKLWDLLKKEDPNKHAAKLGIKPFKKDMAGGQMSNLASTALSGTGPTSSGGALGGEGMMRSEAMKKDEMKKAPVHRTGTGVTVMDGGKPLPKMPGAAPKPAAKPSLSIVKPKTATPAPKASTPAPKEAVHPPVHRIATSKLFDPQLSGTSKPEIKKAMDAGSALAGPANLSQGAALAKPKKGSTASAPASRLDTGHGKVIMKGVASEQMMNKKKSTWLLRAESEYKVWGKREQFETFMKARMPHLTKAEIQVIGQTMLLQKNLEMEKQLAKMVPQDNGAQHSYVAKKEEKK